ncbi:YhgE/Pip family protein [Microbacterium sp. NPDC090218]
MKNILQLTLRDVRHATQNVMACIVLFGLVVIPSLFTWFNVIASWDPFANTKDLKIAVASTDAGYESDLMPIRLNVGEQVLSELRGNDQLDWIITDEHDAIDGTKSGEYYAAIVLPETFSADMLTFYADGGDRTHIALYTNEKKNALAPKITGQGAEGVSAAISDEFTRTLGDVALGLISSMSEHLTDEDTQAALTRVEARLGSVGDQLRSAAHTADTFTALIESSGPLLDSASSLVGTAGDAFRDTSGALGNGVDAVDTLKSTLQTAAQYLSDALAASSAGYDAVGQRIDELFAGADSLSDAQVQAVTTLAQRVQEQIDRYSTIKNTLETEVGPQLPESAQPDFDAMITRLDEAIARQQALQERLQDAATDIAAGNDSAQSSHQEITSAIAEAKKAIADARSSYDTGLKAQLDALSSTLSQIGSDVSGIRSDLSGLTSGLSGASDSVRSTLSRAQEATTQLSESLNTLADRFDKTQQAMAKAADTGDLSELIGADPGVLATSLAEPVRVDRTAVFPVAGFGAAMAPLYMILALWVGALLMTVAIRIDVNAETLPDRPELTPTQKYLGRYGIFGLVGLAQSTLLTLGLILFVQIEPAHPLLLMLAGWVISTVFTLIVYTAVVAFGNAGKALSVLLLVIQISGSGGAYPLQLLPDWFQSISPFLPATYAVNMVRSAIAGVYQGDFWVSLGALMLFIIPALLLGLVLRRPLMSYNRKLVEALESTKLMS